MHIIVTVKQVPDVHDVKIDPKTGTLIREGIPSIINPEDKNAIEEALNIKETRDDVVVTALTLGPPQARSALREALAMGVDRAILLSDSAFAGADTLATSYVLSVAVKKIGACDLILCGRQAIDGDTAQVGPQLAGILKLPQVTYAEKISLHEDVVTVKSNFGSIIRTIEVKLPALITVTKDINKPRYKSMNGVLRAFRDKEIVTWTMVDLDLNPMRIGLNGSPTRVRRTFTPIHSREGLILDKGVDELAEEMVGFLLEKNFLRL
jgi:electron transfer flavoprotein beta subunit